MALWLGEGPELQGFGGAPGSAVGQGQRGREGPCQQLGGVGRGRPRAFMSGTPSDVVTVL